MNLHFLYMGYQYVSRLRLERLRASTNNILLFCNATYLKPSFYKNTISKEYFVINFNGKISFKKVWHKSSYRVNTEGLPKILQVIDNLSYKQNSVVFT